MELTQNIYLYGKFYDTEKEKMPSRDGNYDVIIYGKIQDEPRTISSLGGIFSSSKELRGERNLLLKRDDMRQFETIYNGRFIPFENGGKK